MRHIKFIAVHCTATPQSATLKNLLRYWKEELQWEAPGYHYLIKPDGEIEQLLPENKISNGVSGFNACTINVSYIGGINSEGKPADNRTPEQKAAMQFLLENLKERYPKALILGHQDFPGVNKACPCFNAKEEYKALNP